jgi:iron complex outermembrane receptor protein
MNTKMLLFAASPIALLAVPAYAQVDAPAGSSFQESSAEPSDRSGEIIVTARKRQEAAIDVPVIETVLGADVLRRSQVVDLSGVVRQVPGLQIGTAVLTVGTQISLRGVGTSSLDAGVDQSVAVNIDGLQLTQGASLGVGLFDMAQVEVLKGPQALFFGKNSPGGVIAVRTADPGKELEVIARGSYEFYAREKRGELIVSSPLSDTLGVRLAGMYSNDDGYFLNKATAQPGTGGVTPAGRYNFGSEYIVRGTVVWKPTDSTRVRLKVNHTGRELTGGGGALGSCPDGRATPAPFGPGLQFINPNDDCSVDRDVYIVDLDPAAFPQVRNNGVPFLKYRTTFGTLELEQDLGDHTSLTSTTAYYKTTVDGLINGVNAGFTGPTLFADNHFTRRDFTQELRIQSDFPDSPLNYLIGAYYQNAKIMNRVYVGGNTFLRLPATLIAGRQTVSIKSYSVFGQLRYKITPELELAAGARYTDERRHDDAEQMTSIDSSGVPIAIARPNLGSKNVSPEITITYQPNDDLTFFGAYKHGYKSGSYVLTVIPAAGEDNSFNDESVRGGELGVKTRLLDRSLNLSLAGYYYKYRGLQVGTNEIAQNGVPVLRTVNAASAKVYGIDFEASYRPRSIEGLSLRLGANWNKARFENFDNAVCIGGQTISQGCNHNFVPNPDPTLPGANINQSLSGVPLPKAADWQVNGDIDYEMPVGDKLRVGFGVNGQYSSKFLTLLGYHRDDFYQPAFFKLGASVRVGAKNDLWELALIANNLTNNFTSGNCTNFSAATGQILSPPATGQATQNGSGVDELSCIPDRGREVFLRLTIKPTAR